MESTSRTRHLFSSQKPAARNSRTFVAQPAESQWHKRKNWLFLGSEDGGERAAIILTIVASAHRHDLDVWAYLRDVLERLANGEEHLEELLPDIWKANHPQHVRDFRETERQERASERRYRRAKRRIERVRLCQSTTEQ